MATTSDSSFITMAHGNGGRLMRELIEHVFAPALGNPDLDTNADAVRLPDLSGDGEWLITTDGFTVDPLEFPGGNIGSLAIHGTVNDLAVSGATPCYVTLNAFIEEGLALSILERLVRGIGEASRESGVRIVAGDTKVVGRGQGGGLYLATTGVGLRPHGLQLGLDRIRAGDRILVSGPVGDHGTAVLLAREQFGLSGDLQSDATSVLPIAQALIKGPGLRFMRDPTRGGIATVAHEIARTTGHTVRLQAARIPVRPPVRAVCDMLGYDPCYLACEGRIAAVVSPESATAALASLRSLGHRHAAIIGEIAAGRPGVVLETALGGERILEELEDDPLPRIC
ncbi:hydrogenase expression/formation protein HypE [Methylotetracoccus oryzae]|uniref:hydrogenase expression/formation protein HypE n=1 Tax=Methylotetracoccus oryzae TaxID=1919059 RepID=UPI00111B80B8|nr:hydrogenase expression/formation protein HypE [Methylotetracoccus oryzae]